MLAFGATLAAGSERAPTATYRELMGVAGLRRVRFPILSFAATLLVIAIKVSLVQSWATEGTVFWASYDYRNVFRMYLPWFLVGGGMIVVRRLMGGASVARRGPSFAILGRAVPSAVGQPCGFVDNRVVLQGADSTCRS